MVGRIGLAIGTDAVRAVCVRRHRVVWSASRTLTADEPIEATVAQLLRTVSSWRTRLTPVVAAVGPAKLQLRRIAGLPPVDGERLMSRIVRETPARFFLQNGLALVTSDVHVVEGAPWGAAIEQPMRDGVQAGCRSARMRLVAIVPGAAALAGILDGQSATWQDGDTACHLSLSGRRLVALRRAAAFADGSSISGAQLPAELIGAGAGSDRFADAYAAAVCEPRDLPTFPLATSGARTRVSPARRRLAVAAAFTGMLAAVGGPGVSGALEAGRLETALRATSDVRREATRVTAEVTAVSAALGEAARFERSRRSTVAVLGEITAALPTHTAVSAFRLDSTGVTLAVLTEDVQATVRALRSVATLADPELRGPVTRERREGKTLQRASIALEFAPAPDSTGGGMP